MIFCLTPRSLTNLIFVKFLSRYYTKFDVDRDFFWVGTGKSSSIKLYSSVSSNRTCQGRNLVDL